MLHSIQYLRALAAILVVISHVVDKFNKKFIHITLNFDIGAAGVDLFFIISGFIMCLTTYNKEFYFSKFMKNRFKRIIPLYWILTTIALAIYLIAPSLINTSGGNTNILASYFLLPLGDKFLIQNGWTLSYEFFFYLLFAISLYFFENKDKGNFFVGLLLVTLSLIGIFLQTQNPIILFIFNNILIEFSFGIIAFHIYRKKYISTKISLILIFIGFSLLVMENFKLLSNIIGYRSIFYGIPMLLILLGTIANENIFIKSKNKLLKLLFNLGNSSYSLYLIHPFILSGTYFALKKINIDELSFLLILITLSLIFGHICYKFLETPISKFIKNI